MSQFQALFAVAIATVAVPASVPAAAPAAAFVGSPLHLSQITLPTRDLGQAISFYRDTLGLKLLFQVPGSAFFDAGAVRLRLEVSQARPGSGEQIYFDDPGLARAASLRAQGFSFSGPPEIAQRAATSNLMIQDFADPDGNLLAFMGSVKND